MDEKQYQLALFDYDTLDLDTRSFVQTKTAEIRILVKQTAQGIIDTGQRLLEVRDRLEHGQFLHWIETEFGWKKSTAYNLINVASNFQQVGSFDFSPKVLYLLAAPSVPEEARQEALTLAESGERITHQKAQELIAKYKAEVEATKKEVVSKQQVITSLEDRNSSLESKRSSLTKERDFLLESKNKDGICIISQNQMIDQFNQQIVELKAQMTEPQVIMQEVKIEVEKLVEVVPEDYEQLKKEINVLKKTLEDLKQESCEELSQHQTKVRKLTIELTKKEKLLESSSNEEQKQLKGIQKINEGMKCIEEACSLLGNRCENIFHPQLKEVIESSLQSLILFLNNFFCNDKNRK